MRDTAERESSNRSEHCGRAGTSQVGKGDKREPLQNCQVCETLSIKVSRRAKRALNGAVASEPASTAYPPDGRTRCGGRV